MKLHGGPQKHATLFWIMIPMFLGGFLHFFYQWKE